LPKGRTYEWAPRRWELGISYKTSFAQDGEWRGQQVSEGEPVEFEGLFSVYAAEPEHAEACGHVHMRMILTAAGIPWS
jgi:hypothetical protein